MPLSAIRFDSQNDTYSYPDGWSLYTKFSHRLPAYYDNGHLVGAGVDTGAIIELENAMAAEAGIAAWAWDFYLPEAVVGAEDPEPKYHALMRGLEAFVESSNKSLMKFWVSVITDDHYGLSYPPTDQWKYLDDFADYINTLMQDPQYLRIQGKPVIGLFSLAPGGHGPNMDLTRWQQFLTPMGGQSRVFAGEMSGNVAQGQALGLQWLFTYGVQQLQGGQGHQPWTVTQTSDESSFGASVPGFFRVSRINAGLDRRASRDVDVPTDTWMDEPTQPQIYSHFAKGLGAPGTALAITFWNELAEEGAWCAPTAQEGTRYIDAIKWARRHVLPSSYSYPINLHNIDAAIVETSGAWSYVSPYTGVPGAHDSDQVVSSETGAYKKLAHVRMTACDVYAETGPDCGIAEIYKDDVLDQTIDCYAASQTTSAKIATVTFGGAPADHTVKVLVKGTKNAASSSVQIKLDYAKPTYVP